MCSSFSSSGNDLGVWCSERYGCWSRITVHLHYPQFTSGTVTFYPNSSLVLFNIFRDMLGFTFRFDDSVVVSRLGIVVLRLNNSLRRALNEF